MIFEYGGHRHPDAEVALRSVGRRALVSPRDELYAHELGMDLELTLRSSSGADAVVNLAAELERVYAVQDQRATLYTNSGRIAFRLDPSQSVDGLKVTSLIYPDVTGAALVTTLKARVTLSMTVEVPGASELIDFSETVTYSGGRPKVMYLPSSRGRPTRQVVQRFTPYSAVQSGFAVGRRGRPAYPRQLFPNADLIDKREGKNSPSRLQRGQFRDFGIQWSYTFMSNNPLFAEPNSL